MRIGQDASALKDKIVSSLKQRGPSLPVHIAKEIGLSILFASAFLSELLSEKRLKMSHMRIGSSPLYFTEGQEPLLENFSQHLKSKEKEAFAMLKERKFLKDYEQEPAIRIALREIKDFAIPLKRNEELIWRFFTTPETDFVEEAKPIIALQTPVLPIIEQTAINQAEEEEKPILIPIKEIKTKERKKLKEKNSKIKIAKKKTHTKTKEDEKFLERIKEFLSKNEVEIINIEGLKKDELLLRVKTNNTEQLLVAYKKKKISEKEIIKAAKKASELGLSYSILSMGELPKKISELRDALQNIKDIKKIE